VQAYRTINPTRRPAGAGLAALLLCALVWPADAPAQAPARKGAAAAEPRALTGRGPLAEDELANIAVFRAVSPSTVHITTLATARSFFSADVMEVPRGTGTGFIWDERGHVVTNFHVLQGASGARVTLSDQSEWQAALVGVFPDRDLAVLRIDAPREKMRPIVIGTSRELQVGQRVYAIGNPFGLDQTLTTGIVSALNREIESATQRRIRGVIQTDAAINPGNSGGPLLDSAGRLIGVNTAIYSPSGASAGIGFAIPVDEVNRVVPRLIRDGKFVRPSLGVQSATPQLHAALGLPKGLAVVGVIKGSPAEAAGIVPFRRGPKGDVIAGDLITGFAGRQVVSLDDMLDALERHQPGDTVKLSLVRGGKPLELQVRLGAGQ
jgi:S1-C subfamily serine protease